MSEALPPRDTDAPASKSPSPLFRFPRLNGVAGCAIAATVALLLGAGAAFVVQARDAQQRAADLERAAQNRLVEAFATALSCSIAAGEAATERVVERFARTLRTGSITWQSPEGQVRALWPVTPGGQSASAQPGGSLVEAALENDNGTTLGVVKVQFPGRATDALLGSLAPPALAFAPGFLIALLLGRQAASRAFCAARAIERNLCDYAHGVEGELLGLTLSDTLGETARAWNRILAEAVSLRQEVQLRCEVEKTGAILSRFDSAEYRRLLDRLPVGVLRIGRDLRIGYANPMASSLLGTPVHGHEAVELQAAVSDSETQRRLLEALRSAASDAVIDLSTKDGDRDVDLRFHVLPPIEAGVTDTLIMIEDLGSVRAMERARDDFLYHITHELRTPLTNIRAYVETLTKPEFDDEQIRKECYNVILSETGRLSRLIEEVLSFSQIEVGSLRLEMGDVDIARLLRQLVQDNLGAADEKRIDLSLKLAPKTPKVQGDKQRLAALINNLIGNAVKYTPGGGKVEVTADVAEGKLRIAVADTGIGIGPEDLPHVFDKFYRARTGDVQSITGTGLGLAIARDIARLHGGDVTAQSVLGQGSTFTFELPLNSNERVEAAA